MLSAKSTAGIKKADELLINDVKFYGWQSAIGSRLSFYVRGATWAHNNILDGAKDFSNFVPQKKPFNFFEHVQGYDHLLDKGFKWDDNFSDRQAMLAIPVKGKRIPVSFKKAFQSILLTAHIAEEKFNAGKIGISSEEVFRYMRIEPAVYYISDYNCETFERLEKERRTLQEDLRKATGQTTRQVLVEMAHGHTVTKNLADSVLEKLKIMFPKETFGSVEFKPSLYAFKPASKFESLFDA